MAKAKTSPSPAKGKSEANVKAKAAATSNPPVRRFPRKTVASARKAEAEETAKVTKKTSPAKKKSTVKKLANALKTAAGEKATKAAAKAAPSKAAAKATTRSPTPKKATSPASKTKAAAAKTRSPKKAASPSPAKSATTSPRPRARPRKSASPKGGATSTPPRPRGRPPKNSSPAAKNQKAKANPKKPTPTKGVSAKQSKTRASRKQVPAIDAMDESPDRVQSQPEERPSSHKQRCLVRSTSQHRARQTRSRSPAKAASPARRASGAGVRGRSQSPAKNTRGRQSRQNSATRGRGSHSPSKVTKPSSPRKASVLSPRTQSQGPSKGGRRGCRERQPQPLSFRFTETTGQENGPFWRQSTACIPPGHPWSQLTLGEVFESRAAQIGNRPQGVHVSHKALGKDDFKDAIRQSRWPHDFDDAQVTDEYPGTYAELGTPTAVEHGVHVDETGRTYDMRRLEWKWNGPEKFGEEHMLQMRRQKRGVDGKAGPVGRTRSQSPAKTAGGRNVSAAKSPTRIPTKQAAPRRSSSEVRWDKKFSGHDDYGKTLRKLEMKAYTAQKEGKVFRGTSPHIDDDDGVKARQQGVDRAKAEFALQNLADSREQRVRDGYEDRVVDLSAADDDDDDEAAPKESPANKGKAAARKASNASRKVSSSSQGKQGPSSPKRKQSTACSPRRQPSAEAEGEDTFTPLPPGRPSAPDRGPVHSVTNPEVLGSTSRKNPFFETMPGPEYWQRSLPPFFMFGETPYMQQEISRQMNSDLKKGAGGSDKEPEKPRSSSIAGTIGALLPSWGKSKDRQASETQQEQQRQRKSPFTLRDMTDEEVDAMMQELNKPEDKKRKASGGSSPGRSPRRPRRTSGGSASRSRSPAYRMSGAL